MYISFLLIEYMYELLWCCSLIGNLTLTFEVADTFLNKHLLDQWFIKHLIIGFDNSPATAKAHIDNIYIDKSSATLYVYCAVCAFKHDRVRISTQPVRRCVRC